MDSSSLPKKPRLSVWNPALPLPRSPSSSTSPSSLSSPLPSSYPSLFHSSSPSLISPSNPVDFSQSSMSQNCLPMFFQNYFHLAPFMVRLQQQRQMEQMMRERMTSSINTSTQQKHVVSQGKEKEKMKNTGVPCPAPTNPLVASALGSSPIAENCCAVCGTGFRLTGDLVQHMRNNHRRTRFKRKNEKPIE